MKKVLKNFCMLIVLTLAIVLFAFIFMFETKEPEIIGIIAGVIMSVGFAYACTMLFLLLSNSFGDTGGTIKDFTKEPVEFLR